MPRIPTYKKKVISLPRAPISKGAQEWEIIGHGLKEAAGSLEVIAEKYRQAQQVTQLGNAQVDTLKEITNFQTNLETRDDYENFEPEFNKFTGDIRSRYQKEIKDPDVWRSFDIDLKKMTVRSGFEVRSLARKKQIDKGKSDLFNNEIALKTMLPGANDITRKEIINRFKILISGNVAAGYITEEEGSKRLQKFLADNDTAMAMEDLRLDPEDFDTGKYKYINDKTKILLNDQAIKRADTEERRRINQKEKAEKLAEKNHKKTLEDNEFSLWQEFDQIQDDKIALIAFDLKLEDMAERRFIDKPGYRALKTAIEKVEDADNDPFVMGEIAEKIEFGMPVINDLNQALASGSIKNETYITTRKAIANKDFKRGISFISISMKPTEADKWNLDKHRRYADAIEDYKIRVAAGEDPISVGYDIVELNLSEMKRTKAGLRRPRFLKGNKLDLANLNAAEELTAYAYQSGSIGPEEYKREIDLLQDLKDLSIRLMEYEIESGKTKGLEDRLKKQKGK